jgi:UDP-N-acetylmuramoyl-tripeptide--D-alanyl-D-alanine ligase
VDVTVGDVLEATGAAVVPDPGDADLRAVRAMPFHEPVVDSRQVLPGDLFVALPGTRADGTYFAPDAFARGALAALVRAVPPITEAQRAARRGALGGRPPAPFAALVVPDPLDALHEVARSWRGQCSHVQVVGVTGSVGKTTTREAITAVLAEAMPTLASQRSYNNEIGLPLTLLRLERRHRAAVLEMGMYARGEIAALARMAQPQIGVVTMVAPVHLERLGSLEAIAAAKAELVQALPPGGVAVLNGDDARVRAMAALTPARPVFFGLGAGNDWRAVAVDDRGLAGLAFTLRRGAWEARIETRVVGRHFLHALLAAAAVAEALEVSPARIAAALGRVRIGERQRFLQGPAGRLIIDDAWNASLPSMLAALDVLAAVPRRRVAVLGEMLELGPESEAAHRAVGRRAGEVVAALVAVGRGGATIAEEARRAGLPREAARAVPGPSAVPDVAPALLRPGDGVLVKGSRGLHLEETVRWLLDERGQ